MSDSGETPVLDTMAIDELLEYTVSHWRRTANILLETMTHLANWASLSERNALQATVAFMPLQGYYDVSVPHTNQMVEQMQDQWRTLSGRAKRRQEPEFRTALQKMVERSNMVRADADRLVQAVRG